MQDNRDVSDCMGISVRKQNIQQYENKQHGTELLPYDIYGTKIPEYYTVYPVHWHEEMEIVVAVNGSCLYSVDFKQYEVKEGDILIIPPASLHSFERQGEESFIGFVILFHAAMINNNTLDICSAKYITPIFNNEMYLPCFIPSDSEHNQPLHAIIREILILQMKKIIHYIEEHYNEKITLETLADHAGLSQYHLAHTFKKCTGQSPIEFINHYRLSMAAARLIETDEQIIEIAIDTGFNNISYFNRIFKKRFGVTPKEYRNK